jgi:glutamine amidotransferase
VSIGLRQGIAIVDYGTGNLRSIWRAFNRVGVAASVVSDPKMLFAADKIVLPGVGNFARAMSSLRRLSLIKVLDEAALDRKVPVLGICLGLQLMTKWSEEGQMAGLGWLDAASVRFRPADTKQHKTPYIGWNSVESRSPARLLDGLNAGAEFYFLHSYHLAFRAGDEVPAAVVAETTYGSTFPSIIEAENLFGVQFHPERSHQSGEQVLRNFLAI